MRLSDDQLAGIPAAPARQYDGLGHYTDDDGATWQNESGGAYQEPDEYQPYQYTSPFDVYNPDYSGSYDYSVPFAPDSWSEPAPEPTDYSLNFLTSAFSGYGSPNAADPWGANQQVPDDGGFWGGVKDVAGDVGGVVLDAINAPYEYVGKPAFGVLSGLTEATREPIYDEQGNITGYTRDPGLGGILDIPKAVGKFVADPVGQYGEARRATDEYFANPENSDYWNAAGRVALEPLSYAGPGLASKLIPGGSKVAGLARGLIDQGGGTSVLGAALGGPAATSDVADKIPYFSDQPDWLRGLEGSLLFGTTGLLAPKGLGKGLPVPRGLIDDLEAGQPSLINRIRGAEEGSVDLSTVAKVLPGPISAGGQTAEIGVRPGSLLSPRGAEQLGEVHTVKDVMSVSDDLVHQRGSVANRLMGEADPAWRALGKRGKAPDGQFLFKDIPPSAAEIEAGYGNATVRVLERPDEYALTPAQRAAVDKLADINARVTDEQALFGAPVNKLSLDEGELYIHRKVKKPSTQTQVDMLVNKGAGTPELGGSSGSGRRLGGAKLAPRVYDDPIDAMKAGVIYADPQVALRENIDAGLKRAGDAHIKTLLEPFANTKSDRIPEEFRNVVRQAQATVKKLKGRLETAERRAGIATGKAKELTEPLRRLSAAIVDRATAKDALTEAKKTLNAATREAIAAAKKQGASTDQLIQLIRKANIIEKQIETAMEKMAGVHEVTGLGGIRLPKLASDSAKAAVDRAAGATDEINDLLHKGMNIPIGSAATRAADAIDAGDAATAALRTAEDSAIRAAKDVNPMEIHNTLATMRTRLNELKQRGGVHAAAAKVLSADLDDARLVVADLMPEWQKVDAIANRTPAGLRTVPSDIALNLQGSAFTKRDAAIIEASLRGAPRIGDRVMPANLPGVRILGGILHPMAAVGDFSITANQLAMLGATHRIPFLKNFGKAARDMFDDVHYEAWESGPDVVRHNADKFITLSGKSGVKHDYQFGGWVERAPILRETSKHFTRFGNRMRVDAFNSIIELEMKRSGVEPDDLFKEQTGRAVDRASGVARSRATDIETMTQFAPNFTRSLIENAIKGAADGTLEGQIARQYLKNYIALGTSMVAGVALWQNRDLSEVMTPLDKKALARGEVKLNPNFMTMRVAGQDISVFGAYDSLARLAVIGTDSVYRSMTEKDASQLFDFVGYAASTKGSSLVKLGADLIKGETFMGHDPYAPLELGKRVLPFTAQNVIEDVQQGKGAADIAKDVIIGGFGGKSNPMSPTEKASEFIKGLPYTDYNGNTVTAKDWSELPPGVKQRELDKMDPDLKKELEKPWNDEQETAQKFLAAAIVTQKERDANTSTPLDVWRKDLTQLKHDLFVRNDTIYSNLDLETTDKGLAAYYKAIKDATSPEDKVDWDKVDEYRKNLGSTPAENAAMNKYIDDNTGLIRIDTDKVRDFEKKKDAITDSGYFERSDENWREVVKYAPTWSGGNGINANPRDYDSYDEWKSAALQASLASVGKNLDDVYTVSQIESWLAKESPSKGMDYFAEGWREKWVQANPQEAYWAWQYGYYNPIKEIKAWLAKQFE